MIQTYGAQAWNQATAFNIGNECKWPAVRVYAYFNELFKKWTKTNGGGQVKNFYTFGIAPIAYYRSIYEDQSGGAPPPPAQNEGISGGGVPGADHTFTSGLLMPGDAIPAKSRIIYQRAQLNQIF